MQPSGVRFAEARTLQAIRRYETRIIQAISSCLDRFMLNRSYDTDEDNVVCGLWMTTILINSDPEPIFHAHAGEDYEAQFNGPTCLARDALNKANAAAQSGRDTAYMVDNPIHWLAVEGPYLPREGAIVRSIGHVGFVVSTAGLDMARDNHAASVEVWGVIDSFLVNDTADERRRASLDEDDPEYVKYPIGQLSKDAVARPAVSNSKGLLFSSGWGAARVSPGYAGG